MAFGRAIFEYMKRRKQSKRGQLQPKSKSKITSKGRALFSTAKNLTDLKIGGNQKTSSSSMAKKPRTKNTAVSMAKSFEKSPFSRGRKAKAKKTTGINPGSATINI